MLAESLDYELGWETGTGNGDGGWTLTPMGISKRETRIMMRRKGCWRDIGMWWRKSLWKTSYSSSIPVMQDALPSGLWCCPWIWESPHGRTACARPVSWVGPGTCMHAASNLAAAPCKHAYVAWILEWLEWALHTAQSDQGHVMQIPDQPEWVPSCITQQLHLEWVLRGSQSGCHVWCSLAGADSTCSTELASADLGSALHSPSQTAPYAVPVWAARGFVAHIAQVPDQLECELDFVCWGR